MKQFLVEFIRTGVSQAEQRQVGAYNSSDAIRRIRDELGFNQVTIKSCREALFCSIVSTHIKSRIKSGFFNV